MLHSSALLALLVAADDAEIALAAAILATAAALGSLLYAGSADKRSREALRLAKRADARESERHEANKAATLVLDGFRLSQLDAEHFYATLFVRNVGGATARDISVVLADEHLTPIGERKPIGALEPRGRSNQFQLHAPGKVDESVCVLASWVDKIGPHIDERIEA